MQFVNHWKDFTVWTLQITDVEQHRNTEAVNQDSTSVRKILMIKVFSGQTTTCNLAEYQIGNECCPMCLPGNRVKTDCTEFRSTSCLPCLEGTYMNKPTGLKQCFQCSQCDAGSGLKMKRSCTTTSDTVCEPLEGFFCVDPSDNVCGGAQKHRSCEPGQYISQKGTASTDSVCSDCSDGSFSDGTFPSCRPHTQCEAKNLQLLKPGTTSTDAECEEHSSNKTITGISVSLSVVLIVLICGICLVMWKKKRSTKGHRSNEEVRHPEDGV
ncbi:tumor necrosis factor receptor superfamily member 14-like isoform X2 [Anabas testudineus]|uniref:tumor necrosis factor receptor superfamily member 14-like isoform X2 n=2 Tax=Anabas testudineus TaxID=64144 RepID=UPI00143CDE10|nr:tumor necrosis factor receptor superfamily member 14-like isoform X2 [Anabas testudineus]